MPFLLIVSLLALSFSLPSPATLLPSLLSFPCGFCTALPCFRPSLRTGSSTDCAAAFWRTWEGKKSVFFLWEQSKASLTSSPLIKLSCQKHINNRQHNSLHRERGEKKPKKKEWFLFRRVKRQSTKGSKAFQRFLPLSICISLSLCPILNVITGPLLRGAKM